MIGVEPHAQAGARGERRLRLGRRARSRLLGERHGGARHVVSVAEVRAPGRLDRRHPLLHPRDEARPHHDVDARRHPVARPLLRHVHQGRVFREEALHAGPQPVGPRPARHPHVDDLIDGHALARGHVVEQLGSDCGELVVERRRRRGHVAPLGQLLGLDDGHRADVLAVRPGPPGLDARRQEVAPCRSGLRAQSPGELHGRLGRRPVASVRGRGVDEGSVLLPARGGDQIAAAAPLVNRGRRRNGHRGRRRGRGLRRAGDERQERGERQRGSHRDGESHRVREEVNDGRGCSRPTRRGRTYGSLPSLRMNACASWRSGDSCSALRASESARASLFWMRAISA